MVRERCQSTGYGRSAAEADLDLCAFGESAVEEFDDAVADDAFEFLMRCGDSWCWCAASSGCWSGVAVGMIARG